jgi:hypothetical protein
MSQDPRLEDGKYNEELINLKIVDLLKSRKAGATYPADSLATHLLRFYKAGREPQPFAFVSFGYLFARAELEEHGWVDTFVESVVTGMAVPLDELAKMYRQMLLDAKEEMHRL